MRKGLLGVIVGVGMLFAQSAGAAEMIRYDKSAAKTQPEQTVAQIQMDGGCKGPHCRPCARVCPPKHCHRKKQCGHKHAKQHHKHSVKKQQHDHVAPRGHNERLEEKKMSTGSRDHPSAKKTSYQGSNSDTYMEEYIDDVGREHR